MRSTTPDLQHSTIRTSTPSLSIALLPSSRGFAYIALLVAIIIIGISLGAAGKYWSNVMLREKEKELIFRGDQYRRAIESYVTSVPGRTDYPMSIDDLLKDDRTATGKRHLRHKYKDPISGDDFVEIRSTLTRRIIGVYSPSEKEPLKKYGFPDEYNGTQAVTQVGFPVGGNNFVDKMKYSEWMFVSTIKTKATSSLISGGTSSTVSGGTSSIITGGTGS